MSLLFILIVLTSSRFHYLDAHETTHPANVTHMNSTAVPSIDPQHLGTSADMSSNPADEDCRILKDQRQRDIVESPNYPQNYPQNLDCNYNIELPENTRIQLIFREVQLQEKDKNGHCHDYIEVYDGHVSWAEKIQDKFCGDGRGVVKEPIISSSNKLRIKFVTDERYSAKGFVLIYDPYQPPKDCSQRILKDQRSSIESPDYPNNYPQNLDCNYKIELPENTRIQLIFRDVQLQEEDENGDCHDYIEVYDGHVSWAKKLQGKFCGDGSGIVNQPIISTSNKLRIKFVTDKRYSAKGFTLTYDPYQPPKAVTDMTQKVTGVVIGTACGLVFLILSFLAIWHSRRLSLLRRRGRPHYDIASIDSQDAVEQLGAPPSYYVVMSSPHKYPPTPTGPEKTHRFLEARRFTESWESEEELPSYLDLLLASRLGNNSGNNFENGTRFHAISHSISTDV